MKRSSVIFEKFMRGILSYEIRPDFLADMTQSGEFCAKVGLSQSQKGTDMAEMILFNP
jgi:hypothetical protein